MRRDQYAHVPKARTGVDKRVDVVKFLTMARREMVEQQTPQTLAARYGVSVKVAAEEMQKAGLL